MRYLGQGRDIRPKPFALTGHKEIDVDAPSSRSGDPADQEDESLMPCSTRLPSETALVFCEKPRPSCLYLAPQRCLSWQNSSSGMRSHSLVNCWCAHTFPHGTGSHEALIFGFIN